MNNNNKLLSLEDPHLHLLIGKETDVYNLAQECNKYATKKIISKVIRGENCETLENIYDEFSSALEFPDYFGENWAAFDECITDMQWLQGNGYVIFISYIDKVLNYNDKEFNLFVNILHRSAREWAEDREYGAFKCPATPFHIVFHCLPEKETEVKSRLTKAGLEQIGKIIF